MRRILFLQNGTERFSPSRVDQRFEASGWAVDYYWAFKDEFPDALEGYGGVFISGSPHGAYEDLPWIHREHEIIRDLVQHRIPMLGVCFGSQILASALCGREQVFRRSHCEVGYLNVRLTAHCAQDALMTAVPDGVRMFIWHNDEVCHDHADMCILGVTEGCPNQIWRFRDLPIWGIQGHAELDRDQAVAVFTKNRDRLSQDGADVDQLLREADDTLEAKILINNFIDVCGAS